VQLFQVNVFSARRYNSSPPALPCPALPPDSNGMPLWTFHLQPALSKHSDGQTTRGQVSTVL
jgi:hypothetical protein